MVSQTPDLAITHVTLIDGTGGPPLPDATVHFRDGRVAAAGPSTRVLLPEGCATVDGRGKWLIPGLVDTHVHVTLSAGEPALRHWLAWGVTTVRDLGGDPDVVLALRERERRGVLVGARIVAYGPFLDGEPPIFARQTPAVSGLGNATRVLDTVEAVGAAVDDCLAMDVDGFKLYAGLRPDLIARAVERVDGRVPVNAHLGRTWASEAAAAGVNCLEHVHASVYQDIARPEDRHTREGGNGAMPNYWSWLLEGWARADLDAPYVHRFIDLLVQKGVYLSATTDLLGPGGFPAGPFREDDPDRAYATRAQEERWRDQAAAMERAQREAGQASPAPAPLPDVAVSRAALETQLRFLQMFHRAGGKLLAGTDTGVLRLIPGVALHRELGLLASAGIDTGTILHIATQRAAEAMGRGDVQGSLAPGKRADAVMLTADPLADIGNTRAIEVVVKDGVLYRPDDLWDR